MARAGHAPRRGPRSTPVTIQCESHHARRARTRRVVSGDHRNGRMSPVCRHSRPSSTLRMSPEAATAIRRTTRARRQGALTTRADLQLLKTARAHDSADRRAGDIYAARAQRRSLAGYGARWSAIRVPSRGANYDVVSVTPSVGSCTTAVACRSRHAGGGRRGDGDDRGDRHHDDAGPAVNNASVTSSRPWIPTPRTTRRSRPSTWRRPQT